MTAVLLVRAAYAHAQMIRDNGHIILSSADHLAPLKAVRSWAELLETTTDGFDQPASPGITMTRVPGLDEFIPQLVAAEAGDDRPDHVARVIHPMSDYISVHGSCM